MAQNLQWLDSLGGPWILAPIERARSWCGAAGKSVNMDGETDYEAVCKALVGPDGQSKYVNSVEGTLLSLGELASGITILKVQQTPCLVEWMGADSDSQLADRLSAASRSQVSAEAAFQAVSSEYVLFDSVFRFLDCKDWLPLELKTGTYRAQTEFIDLADGQFALTRLKIQ